MSKPLRPSFDGRIVPIVLTMTEQHSQDWRDMPDSYWFARLVEEVGELAGSLVDNHEDSPEWELTQIASICLNWLDMRSGRIANGNGTVNE